MPKYNVDTDAIRTAGGQLRNKAAQEVEAAVQAADSAIAPCRSMQSPRVLRDVETWDTLRASLRTAIENLAQAGQELDKLAQDVEAANA